MTRPPVAYLAGPISLVGRDHAIRRERSLQVHLEKRNIASFGPAQAWSTGLNSPATTERVIQVADDFAVAVCDLVIVSFEGVVSRGTDHEVRLAMDLRKPIIAYLIQESPGMEFDPWLLDMGLDPSSTPYVRRGQEEWIATLAMEICARQDWAKGVVGGRYANERT